MLTRNARDQLRHSTGGTLARPGLVAGAGLSAAVLLLLFVAAIAGAVALPGWPRLRWH